jgi:adenosine deaminase
MALPGVTRISHGVRAIEDPSLVAELADRGLVLEVCPGSNVALGVYGSFAEHPLPALHAAGVTMTLGSDDPPYFATSIGHEYALAHEHLGVDLPTLRSFTENALTAAFSPADVVADLRTRLHPE